MIRIPKIGAVYWYITEIYEVLAVIPVRLIMRGGIFNYSHDKTRQDLATLYTVHFELVAPGQRYKGDPGYCEEYDASCYELYKTERAAQIALKGMFNGE